MKELKIGRYRHTKTGNLYRVIGVAKHSETLEDFVVYECLYENSLNKLWIRSVKMFLEIVTINGQKAQRFKYIGK